MIWSLGNHVDQEGFFCSAGGQVEQTPSEDRSGFPCPKCGRMGFWQTKSKKWLEASEDERERLRLREQLLASQEGEGCC